MYLLDVHSVSVLSFAYRCLFGSWPAQESAVTFALQEPLRLFPTKLIKQNYFTSTLLHS